MTPESWDDDRLAEAFVVRAGEHLTPAGLASSTIDAVRGSGRASRRLGWRRWFAAAAAGIGVLVIIGLLARPSANVGEPDVALTTVHGLPVITVAEAIDVRGSGFDDRELAVRGWFTSEPGRIVECPFTPDFPPPLDRPCDRSVDWLMQDPESLYTVTGEQTLSRAPFGRAIDPDLQGVEQAWAPSLATDGTSSAMDVVLVGHFDDRRASACSADRQSVCLDRFIVDAVAWADGVAVPQSVIRIDEPTEMTPDDVRAALAAATPDKPILSIVAFRRGDIGSVEPAIATPQSVLAQSIVWRAQVLIDGHAVTYLVEDETGLVYRMDVEGPPILASGPPGSQIDSVFGIPVITVEEAIALRDGGVDDREIAVRGWFASVAVPCPSLRPEPPFGLSCPDQFRWLTASSEQPDANGPLGPFIRPLIESGIVAPPAGQEVILVGHFHDRREPTMDWFIVDGFVSGTTVPGPAPAVAREVETTQSEPDGVATAVRAASPTGSVMWMVAYAPGQVAVHEPSMGNELGGDLVGSIVWRVGVLEAGHLVTYLVPDDTPSVYRMSIDGSSNLVSGASHSEPTPIPSAGGLGQHTYRATLDLLSLSGAALPLQITDASGYLVDARSASRAELDFFDRPITAGQIRIENLLPFADTTLIALWDTTCDFDMTMSLFSREAGNYFGDPRLVPTDLELRSRQTLCDGLTVRRGVVLRYEVPVSADDITATRSVEPLSTSWPPADAMTVVTLTTSVGAGRPPVEVAAVDESDHLTSAAEAHADGIPASVVPEETLNAWIAIDPTDARRVYVGWTGGVCDSHATITVGRDIATVTFDGGPHPPCRLMAIGRAVVLTFDEPLAGPPSLLVSTLVDGTPESPG